MTPLCSFFCCAARALHVQLAVMYRKIGALILLIALLTVPFIDWRVGAWLWLCAGLVHIFQGLFRGRPLPPPDIAGGDGEADNPAETGEVNDSKGEDDSK